MPEITMDGGCRMIEPGVIMCSGRGITYRVVRHCHTCGTRRRMIDRFEVWYGITRECCTCGDVWEDGCRLERPFRRGWKQERTAKSKALWATLPNYRQVRGIIRAEMENW